MKYYEVLINQTSKPVASKENYQLFNQDCKKFLTIKEAKDYLIEIYGKCKKQKIYADKKDGSSQHIGYIYCFKNKDWSHNSEWWTQQDWVEVKEINSTPIIIK